VAKKNDGKKADVQETAVEETATDSRITTNDKGQSVLTDSAQKEWQAYRDKLITDLYQLVKDDPAMIQTLATNMIARIVDQRHNVASAKIKAIDEQTSADVSILTGAGKSSRKEALENACIDLMLELSTAHADSVKAIMKVANKEKTVDAWQTALNALQALQENN